MGAREIVDWYAEPTNQVVDDELDSLMDRIILAYESAFPK
jgi:hypothetical protein